MTFRLFALPHVRSHLHSNLSPWAKAICVGALVLLVGETNAVADAPIETVVITATRTAQPAERTGESIDVITTADLQTQQIAVVSDALAEIPGLTINRSGGIGQPTSASIRGAQAGQTVLLVDGVRFNDPSSVDDSALLQDLLANNVERIEVLRGPQSTLYGSDAIGGVVNVITRRGASAPFNLEAAAEGGSLDTVHLNVAANGTDGPVEYGSGVNYYDTRSVSAADSRNGNHEPDPYQHISATSSVRIHVADAVSVDLRGTFINGHDSFDDAFRLIPAPPFSEVADSKAYNNNQLFAGYAGVNFDLFGGTFRNRLAVMATASDRKFFNSFFDPGALNSTEDGEALRFEYQGIVDPTPVDEITFGAETQRSGFRSSDYFAHTLFESDAGHSRISGYYLQAQHRFFDQLTVTGGVRLDDDSEFGTHTSLKLAGAWEIPGWGTILHANYGDGFRAPTLFEDFSVFKPPVPLVPALKPESAKGWEIGARQILFASRVVASLTFFERNTSNLIDFFTCFVKSSGPGCANPLTLQNGGYYFNAGRTHVSGLEAELTARLTDTLKLTANYTNLTALDRDTHLPLAREPHVEANAILVWTPMTDASLGGSVSYVGPRFDDAAASVALHPVALFNVFGSYGLTEKWQLFARIENLCNTHYDPLFGYGAPARTAFAGIRLQT